MRALEMNGMHGYRVWDRDMSCQIFKFLHCTAKLSTGTHASVKVRNDVKQSILRRQRLVLQKL
jgi:hypothetical protein